jgi:hypothetical protein
MRTDHRTRANAQPAGVGGEPVGRPAEAPVKRLAFRIDDISKALGISRRAIEREKAAGRLPKPDLVIGRMPLWSPETIRAWVEGGGRS